MKIYIDITEKRATVRSAPVIVCGNTDYTLAFTFDEEWAGLDKIARLVFWRDGALQYLDLALEGDALTLPAMANTEELYVGAYAGDLRTTAPARIQCLKSVKCLTSEHAGEQPEDIYSQMLELMNVLEPQVEELGSKVKKLEAASKQQTGALNSQASILNALNPLRIQTVDSLPPHPVDNVIYMHKDTPKIYAASFGSAYFIKCGTVYNGGGGPAVIFINSADMNGVDDVNAAPVGTQLYWCGVAENPSKTSDLNVYATVTGHGAGAILTGNGSVTLNAMGLLQLEDDATASYAWQEVTADTDLTPYLRTDNLGAFLLNFIKQ